MQLAIDIYIYIDDPGARTQTVSQLFAVRSIENHTTHTTYLRDVHLHVLAHANVHIFLLSKVRDHSQD